MLLPLAVGALPKGSLSSDAILTATIISYILAAFCGLLFFVLPCRIRQRRRETLQRRGVFYRLLCYPFLDGSTCGIVYFWLLWGVITALTFSMLPLTGYDIGEGSLWAVAVMVFVYVPYIAALTRGAESLVLRRPGRGPGKRLPLLLGVLVLIVLAFVLIVTGTDFKDPEMYANPATALVPPYYLSSLGGLNEATAWSVLLRDLFGPLMIGVVLPFYVILRHLVRFLITDGLSAFNAD